MIHAFRLLPGQDLKDEIIRIVQERKIAAGCILTVVGSLSKAKIRTSDMSELNFDEPLEITSLSGTLSLDDVHLHINVSDKLGKTYGGHLKGGCLIDTTVELVIQQFSQYIFNRKLDPDTGFDELEILDNDN